MATLLSTFETMTFSVKLLLFLLLLLLHNPVVVHCIPEPELESMLSALRSKGYNLFGNAITTSDLRYDILAGSSFTFFAPSDDALFALDLKATATEYVNTLSYHIIPRRFSVYDLRLLNSGQSFSLLRTLLPNHSIRISAVQNRSPESYVITANGVDVVFPGLFYDRHVVVHGLNGILNRRSDFRSHNRALPPDLSFPPRMNGADATDSNSGVSAGTYGETENTAYGLPPGFQDPSLLSPALQPPVIGSPDLELPLYGSPAPQGYVSPSPAVEAPDLQSSEYWSPEDPSPSDEFPATPSDSDGYARGKRLELSTGRFPHSSWFSSDL